MDQHEHTTRRLIQQINAEITRATGSRYRIELETLGADSLREMLRLLRDLDYEKRSAENRARSQPLRRRNGIGREPPLACVGSR